MEAAVISIQQSSTWWMVIICSTVWIISHPAHARPISEDAASSEGLPPFAFWVAGVAGLLCVTVALAVCVCCRKPKGFAEFRSSTQLTEMSPGTVGTGELTLFPPPSLSLDREDLDVSFEPLPKPGGQTANSYRPKEVTEWIENGQGLFPRYNIQYLREIGRGWFGQVVEAEVKDLIPGQPSTRCVVKILRPESAGAQHSKFLRDVQPLLKLDHPNILKLYGCCLETSPLLVLLQHCPNGDLKQFLAVYGPSKGPHGMPPLPENVLLRMAWEAAEGLSHWHQAGLCHPDVAARSYLVTGDMSVVLGDYGTHTSTYREDFVDTGTQLLPVRWCAPECFQPSGEVIHTQAGNVWSFGVVLWEILSLGARPYAVLTDDQVIQQVLVDKRTILNPPNYQYQQGQSVYQLMLQCWEVTAPVRPKADAIAARLAAACASASRDVESDLEKAFDSRWNAAAAASNPSKGAGRSSSVSPDGEKRGQSPSPSLNNLHGSLDNLDDRGSGKDVLSPDTDKSESGFSAKVSAALRSLDEALAAAEATDDDDDGDNGNGPEEETVEEEEEPPALPEPEFRLGGGPTADGPPAVEDIEDVEQSETSDLFSLTRTDWQEKVVRGELTALVREKSRSVQDLMILTHVEPMSDIEFLAMANQQQQQQAPRRASRDENDLNQSAVQPFPAAPVISVTSPSNTTRSPMMESDAPLLDSTDGQGAKTRLDPSGSPMMRNRNRLTSTPREDTDFDAMESSFRSEHRSKPADYGPFSPESLDATEFTRESKELRGLRPSDKTPPFSTSTEELCATRSESDSVFQAAAGSAETAEEPARLAVNPNDWNHLLQESYPPPPQIRAPQLVEELIEDPPGQLLRDSGFTRHSFGSSVDDVLGGSAFAAAVGDETANREWMDDLSLVARMWNEELAAALALDTSLLQNPAAHLDASALTDPSLELSSSTAAADVSVVSNSSPSAKSYFCYDRIDDDIRPEDEQHMESKKPGPAGADLSTIREEEFAEEACGEDAGATGRDLLSQLQMKGRIQRHLELCDEDDSTSEDRDEDEDDDEDVLVVDLENKRAVMLEGQSPKLKAAIASQDYGPIFGASSSKNGSVVVNGEESDGSDDDDEDDGQEANDFEEDDDDDDAEEDDDDGIMTSNFVWQACYPAKLNQSFSMEVIEEECEEEGEEDSPQPFVPSTWRADATPTRPAMRKSSLSPEKNEGEGGESEPQEQPSPKKNVSFSQPRRKEVYQYPVEPVEEPPVRRLWSAPSGPLLIQSGSLGSSVFASLADWDFSAEDSQTMDASSAKESSVDDTQVAVSMPKSNRPSSNLIYRLSGIDDEGDDGDYDGDFVDEKSGVGELSSATVPQKAVDDNEEFFKGEWPSQFHQSEFQPDQFFSDWEAQGGSPSSSAKSENSHEEAAKTEDVRLLIAEDTSRSEDEEKIA